MATEVRNASASERASSALGGADAERLVLLTNCGIVTMDTSRLVYPANQGALLVPSTERAHRVSALTLQ